MPQSRCGTSNQSIWSTPKTQGMMRASRCAIDDCAKSNLSLIRTSVDSKIVSTQSGNLPEQARKRIDQRSLWGCLHRRWGHRRTRPIIVNLLADSVLCAWVGADIGTRLKVRTLYRVIAVLLALIALKSRFPQSPPSWSRIPARAWQCASSLAPRIDP